MHCSSQSLLRCYRQCYSRWMSFRCVWCALLLFQFWGIVIRCIIVERGLYIVIVNDIPFTEFITLLQTVLQGCDALQMYLVCFEAVLGRDEMVFPVSRYWHEISSRAWVVYRTSVLRISSFLLYSLPNSRKSMRMFNYDKNHLYDI